MRGQLWRTVRTLGVAFLLMSGLGALFEEKGLSRGMLANPDMQPQLETKTKFADVKGVDEAKVLHNMCCRLPLQLAAAYNRVFGC
jgi:ATP-dependent metalloprotease